jgi:hypothetical protein
MSENTKGRLQEAALTGILQPYWRNPTKLRRLVGHPWWWGYDRFEHQQH